MPVSGPNPGARRPTHVGTRVFTEGEEDYKLLAAFPIFKGETVERIAIEGMTVAKDDGENLDQPPIFGYVGTYVPMDVGGTAIGAAYLDGLGERYESSGAGEYIGGEPNPGGNRTWGESQFGYSGQTVFRRYTFGDPIPTGRDALNNAEGRYYDHFKTVIKRQFVASTTYLWMFWARSPRLDAQTDFGVTEMDNSASANDIMSAYSEGRRVGGLTGQSAKTAELLYGGDNYIEADSFKEVSRRAYCIVRPTIRRNAQLLS